MSNEFVKPSRGGRWPLLLLGLVLVANGAVLAVNGARRTALGGSWYYLITGVLLIASGVCHALRRMAGFWLLALVFVGTVAWALAEVGTEFWPQR